MGALNAGGVIKIAILTNRLLYLENGTR